MIYKKEKNLFLIVIFSSLFLKLFYAADESKYEDLIHRCFLEPNKGFIYPQYILKKQIKELTGGEEQAQNKNPYALYKATSSIYHFLNEENEENENDRQLKESFVCLDKEESSSKNQLIEALKQSIFALERDSLESMHHSFFDFFHNVYFQNTYEKYFASEDKKNTADFLKKIYSFLKDYFGDYRDFSSSIGNAEDSCFKQVNNGLPFVDKYYSQSNNNINESIEFLFSKFEGIDTLFRLIFLEYISLRQVLEKNGVPLDRLNKKYGFKEINDMKTFYEEDLKSIKAKLLPPANERRTYAGCALLGLSAGLGMYDFVNMFFIRNGNFLFLDGFHEIKRLTVNDLKSGMVDICKEPKQHKAKIGSLLCGSVGLWFGTRNFILRRKKQKLQHIVDNLNFKELLEDGGEVSVQMEKNREAFEKKKNFNKIEE